MAVKDTKWRTYEEIAVFLLNQIATILDLQYVEGQQEVRGRRSGTTWKIDGRGVKTEGEGFVIIECRRYTKSKQKQEQMAALAYRIQDTGAEGGIIVSPLGIQEGAAKVANAENIQTVHMEENSTRTDYILSFLNRAFIGVSETMHVTEKLTIEKIEGPEA
jgi:Restriction endonuclease